MASMKNKIRNGQAFQRLVVDRYSNTTAQGLRVKEISDIELRAQTFIKIQNEHYKRHYDRFVNQETFRQISEHGKNTSIKNAPSVSKKEYEACNQIAKQKKLTW